MMRAFSVLELLVVLICLRLTAVEAERPESSLDTSSGTAASLGLQRGFFSSSMLWRRRSLLPVPKKGPLPKGKAVPRKKGMHNKKMGMHKRSMHGRRNWKPATRANSEFLGRRFGVAYNPQNAFFVPPSGITIQYAGTGGTRIYSTKAFKYGVYTADIATPQGKSDGVVTGFYLSSSSPYTHVDWQDPKRDEIDLEWVGNNKTLVQTNYLVNGVGISKNEFKKFLPFNHAAQFHTYRLVYTPRLIEFQVDNILIHRVTKRIWQPIPSKDMFLYITIWGTREEKERNVGVLNWAGRYNPSGEPYKLQVSNIYVPKAPPPKK